MGWITAVNRNASPNRADTVMKRRIRRRYNEQLERYQKHRNELFNSVREEEEEESSTSRPDVDGQ
jgi:hypothetical protein